MRGRQIEREILLVVDLTRGLTQPLSLASGAIWAIFIIDFGTAVSWTTLTVMVEAQTGRKM